MLTLILSFCFGLTLGFLLCYVITRRTTTHDSINRHNALVQSINQNSHQITQVFEQKVRGFAEESQQKISDRYREVEKDMAPINSLLNQVTTAMAKMESVRQESYKSLEETCQSMSQQFSAVFASNYKAGAWGEIQLQKILELAGMSQYVDFELQQTLVGREASSRPDALIKLPGDRCVVVDAKTPLQHYIEAQKAAINEPELAKDHKNQFVKGLKAQIKQLAKKNYLQDLCDSSVGEQMSAEFVVLFLPLEGLYFLALEQGTDIFEEASNDGVIIATPSTMLAMMKTIALIWQKHNMARHSGEIHRLCCELIKALTTDFREELRSLGKSLDKTVKEYRKASRNFDNTLYPCEQRLRELDVIKK
ncbi:MAG: DNA recombination protein RmuC [Proteobacteria bacterium]|nr:DNA recombination protein RmuC [Pseudomonadota bacterium]